MGKVIIMCTYCDFKTKYYEPKEWKEAEAEYRDHLKLCRRGEKA